MIKETKTWKQAAKLWANGEIVGSAELGGIGPGYEQAIQVLLFEIMCRWEGKVPPPNGDRFPDSYNDHVDKVVKELKDWGFSGAQVGSAKSTAYQFMYYGYSEMMNKLSEDRHILVSNTMTPQGRV